MQRNVLLAAFIVCSLFVYGYAQQDSVKGKGNSEGDNFPDTARGEPNETAGNTSTGVQARSEDAASNPGVTGQSWPYVPLENITHHTRKAVADLGGLGSGSSAWGPDVAVRNA